MLKKCLCLSVFILSNSMLGYDVPSVKSVSEFAEKHHDAFVCLGTAATVVVAAKCVQACVQSYNDYCARCAVEEAARQKVYEEAEKARQIAEKERKIAEAKKVMSEAFVQQVQRLESLAKTSIEADLVAHAEESNYPLAVRDLYKRLIDESKVLSCELFVAKRVLDEIGVSFAFDEYVSRLNWCENRWREKLAELSTTAIYQKALQWEQAQEMLRLEKQRIENERLARERAEKARLEKIRLEQQRINLERQRLAEERWRRQTSKKTNVTVVTVNQTVVTEQPEAAKPAAKPVVKPAKKPVVQQAPAQVEEPSKTSYSPSFDSLCDMCDQAYNG